MRKLAVVACLIATPAFAGNWVVDTAKSSLTFSGQQADEKFNGDFKKFTSDIDFSEAAPEKGKIHITIDMASATVDGKDRNDALFTDDWFGIKKFPVAEFISSKIVKAGEHKYIATGTLTLHGATKEITLPFALTGDTKATRAEGETVLRRDDYRIGQGRWADDQWIAFPVTVHYVIAATAK